MSAEKGNVGEVWGFFGQNNQQAKLSELYSRYAQETLSLQRKIQTSTTRSPTREARLKELTGRLMPALQAQLEG